MDFALRHRALLDSLLRHADCYGCQLRMRQLPEEAGAPFEYALSISSSPEAAEGTLFIFAPEEIYLTSQLLHQMTRSVARAEVAGGPSVLLFSDTNLPALRNILRATGLEQHAQIASYSMERETSGLAAHLPQYRFHWMPLPASVAPEAPAAGYHAS
jgi:hypothetical protein